MYQNSHFEAFALTLDVISDLEVELLSRLSW